MLISFRTWAGRVPRDWDVVPAGIAFSESKEFARPDDPHLTPSQNYGVVTQDEYRDITGHQLVRNTKSAANMKHVEPDDFIISMASHLSGLERSRVTGKVSGDYRVLRPNSLYSPGFLGYLMKSRDVVASLHLLTTEIRVGQRISYDRFSLLDLPLPPLKTQRAIAEYLDRETTEIDAMSADLDEMEALLRERRSVGYSDAVFGRSAVADPQNAGVRGLGDYREWTGQIPADWKLIPLPLLFKERSEKNHADDPHLTPSQRHGVVTQEEYVETSGATVVKNLKGANSMKHVEPGDFVSHLRSFQGGLELSRLRGKVSTAYTVLKGSKSVDVSYYRHLFKSADFIHGLSHLTNQLRDGQTINYARLEKLVLPVPPLEEQRRIADEIDRETAEIDAMIADITELRDLLAERRAAVIAAAVTGQIDIPAAEETTHD